MRRAGEDRRFSLHGLRPGLGIPQWSPDGSSIALTASDLDNGVYVVHADGTGLRLLA